MKLAVFLGLSLLIVNIKCGVVSDVVDTVRDEAYKVKEGIKNIFSHEHTNYSCNRSEEHYVKHHNIVKSVTNFIGDKTKKVTDGIFNLFHKKEVNITELPTPKCNNTEILPSVTISQINVSNIDSDFYEGDVEVDIDVRSTNLRKNTLNATQQRKQNNVNTLFTEPVIYNSKNEERNGIYEKDNMKNNIELTESNGTVEWQNTTYKYNAITTDKAVVKNIRDDKEADFDKILFVDDIHKNNLNAEDKPKIRTAGSDNTKDHNGDSTVTSGNVTVPNRVNLDADCPNGKMRSFDGSCQNIME